MNIMMVKAFLSVQLCLVIIISIHVSEINSQSGPDPWHYDSKPPDINDKNNIPPDLRMPLKSKVQTESKLGIGENFFRRMLAIILKGGQTQQNEDGSVDISLSMKFEPRQWKTLEDSLKSETPLSEDMLRKSMGYVQESIYKPSIVEKIVMAWSDYIHVYLTEYKIYITWALSFLAVAGGLLWLWSHISHKHVIIIIFIIFYAYEVIISYKEAEQKELDKFLSAVDSCKWLFWKSTCEVPPPDPLIFLKHMNPLKIAMRMFTTALAEPIVAISGTVEVILHGVTGGLWYPFDKLAYGVLVLVINISLIFFFIMIIFNWILNIPFGFFGISIKQRKRKLFTNQHNTTGESARVHDVDTMSQATLNRILDVCTLALSNNTQNKGPANPMVSGSANAKVNVLSIRRTASTGRLPNFSSSFESDSITLDSVKVRRRNRPHDGSGDAL